MRATLHACSWRQFGRLLVAAVSGAITTLCATKVVSYALFAAGGYTLDALIELETHELVWIGIIGAVGGLAASTLAEFLPVTSRIRGAAIGALMGAASVTVPTLFLASSMGGITTIRQAPYLVTGLKLVPIGIAVGSFLGASFYGRAIRG